MLLELVFGAIQQANATDRELTQLRVQGELRPDDTELPVPTASERWTVEEHTIEIEQDAPAAVRRMQRHVHAYAEAVAGYASGRPEGVAGWLVHCCRATEHGAVEGLAICESLLRG